MQLLPARRPEVTRGIRRGLCLALAGLCFLLALLGAFLPILPTTPFLLLTSFFLVRSSPALHARLRGSKLFGPILRDWEEHRAVRPRVKWVAVLMMLAVVVLGASAGDLPPPLFVLLLVVATIGLVVVLRLPVIPNREP